MAKKNKELTLFDPGDPVPSSREVRLEDGITDGYAEHVALSIYSGSTKELLDGITSIELTIEARRANAARSIAKILRDKLMVDGYLVISDIDHALMEFLEAELPS